MEIKRIRLNKNRGWRGLAEVDMLDTEKPEKTTKMIFSFSQEVWYDLIGNHCIVMQDEDYYYVINFEDPDHALPKPTQQRSVLIKNFRAEVTKVNKYVKMTKEKRY